MKVRVETKKIGGSFAGLRHPIRWVAVINGRSMLRRFDSKKEAKDYGNEIRDRLIRMEER